MAIIRDIALKDEGHQRIAWVAKHMPVLNQIGEKYEKTQPFKGLKISLSIHLEAKTAYLAKTLARCGAEMHVTGSNPLSTQDAICAALVDDGIEVYAIHGSDSEQTLDLWKETIACKPHIVIDDGSDLINLLLTDCKDYAVNLIGGCEETTSGVQRLRGWEASGLLHFPVMAINDARCKSFFDNTYGTGQSSWDGIMRTTNMQVNGQVVVVAGYGYCGRGIAKVAKGLGARVIVTEIDPVKSILAIMDGFEAKNMAEAAPLGDIFITATSCCNVIRPEHFNVMKDGAIVCNAGHFNIEIDLAGLNEMAVSKEEVRKNIDAYLLENGRTINVIADGALVNIAAADGHPIEIMDISFSLQALGALYILEHQGQLAPGVHAIPDEVDRAVAEMKLKAFGGSFDILLPEQIAYMESH
ncbi:MAG TPA: adenosylhomocysteinase [Clostridiaceae bacterium]|nr:adenosylhomocysteinase [Clostridiaceae bacterium]